VTVQAKDLQLGVKKKIKHNKSIEKHLFFLVELQKKITSMGDFYKGLKIPFLNAVLSPFLWCSNLN
jgi:hypothetical protein